MPALTISLMLRFRAILLWLVMLAVPFQGYAAAVMMFCVSEAPSQASSVGATHDHAMHDHAAGDHATVADVEKANAHDHAARGDSSDASHACSACGNCGPCHAIAMISTLPALEIPGLPQAGLNAPSDAMRTVSPGVLDKPPRA